MSKSQESGGSHVRGQSTATFATLLMAFTPCFQARSVVIFQWLVLGWVQGQQRRTITTVALAAGAVGQRHISVFHRFFSRASWPPRPPSPGST